MKIQLKRSNQLDGSKAKEPTADQMEYGELAVNYNEQDPAIFLKDNTDNIIRISGREVPMGPTPPPNPLPGNFWYNPEDGRLYIWYQDADSAQWVDASPDDWRPEILPDMDDDNIQGGTLDDRYVNITGDNMTGNLTLGTDKITLNADNGNIFSEGAIVSTRFNVTSQLASEETINGATKQFALSVKNAASIYRASLDYSGNLALGDDAWSTPNIYLKGSDGSAQFAGEVQVGSDAVSTNGAFLSPNGVVRACRDGANSIFVGRSTTLGLTSQIDADGSAYFGGTLPSAPNISLNADGSITAASTVQIGDYAENNGVTIYGWGETSIRGTCTATTSGVRSIAFQGAGNDDHRVFLGKSLTSNQVTTEIYGDGSAEFAGDIDSEGKLFYGNTGYLYDGDLGNIFTGTDNGTYGTVIGVDPDRAAPSVGRNIVFSTNISLVQAREVARFNPSGDLLIGGTLPSAPNISLNASGDISAAGGVRAQYVRAKRDLISEQIPLFYGLDTSSGSDKDIFHVGSSGISLGTEMVLASGTVTNYQTRLRLDGSAQFAGNVEATNGSNRVLLNANAGQVYVNTSTSAALQIQNVNTPGVNQILLNNNGSAEFKGLVTFSGGTSGATGRAIELDGDIGIQLEPDNPANYTTDVDEEGNETQTYTGPTLDVKDRLQKADAALLALKTAALAATDFASLQSAIVTALADI